MIRPGARSVRRRVDLHCHSIFSDGSLTPEALVALAVERGLSALSITDHDSVEALEPARRSAESAIELVPGIEMSAVQDGHELHILGYFLDPTHEPLVARLARFRKERVERALAMVERLRSLGLGLEPAEVLELAGPGVVGRPHVAAALLRAGHISHVDEAFRRYLGPQGQAFVPRPMFPASQAILLIHEAGGVAVIAHPGGSFDEARLAALVDAGLRGIEIWHPQHSAIAIRRLRALAQHHGLLETGGSDFHGPQRGTDLGELPVPSSVLQHLKDAAGVAG